MKKAAWIIIVLLATTIGVYPILYFVTDMSQGLLSSKSEAILDNVPWRIGFYTHIICGGIGLLIGWTQFSTNLKRKYLLVHRTIGKTYVITCLTAGIAALYIAPFATGGMISSLGFGTLAVLWMITTSRAYLAIRHKEIETHRKWMIRSYALTFAAVTLRLWLPLAQFVLHNEFIPAYQAISWLCWVPNLLVAEVMVRGQRQLLETVLS